jgi:hypothetical protein
MTNYVRVSVVSLLLLAGLSACTGPLGRVGFDPDVLAQIKADDASSCVVIEHDVCKGRIIWWRDTTGSNMHECLKR